MGISSGKTGIAVVGTGFGKKVHIPGFQHCDRAHLAAVYHRALAQAKQVAAENQIDRAYSDLSELLSDRAVEAVSIATPPFLHYEMAKQTLLAGKHLLLEKPLNLQAEETRELYQLARQKNLITCVDFEFRFVPTWQLLANYLQENHVGKKRLIKIDWLVPGRANPQRGWNWYAQKSKGGGALGAIGSHAFDYIAWLFGPIKRLCAQLSTAILQRPDPTDGDRLKPVDADDTCLLLLELADGTPCQLTLSSVTYQGRGHWVEVYGELGTLVLGSSNLKDYVHGFKLQAAPAGEALKEVTVPKELAFPQVFTDGRIAPFIRVCNRFLDSIEAGKSLAPSLKEGVYSQLLIDLTHESNAQGTLVDVPDLDRYLHAGR